MKAKLPKLSEYEECVLLAEYLDKLKNTGKIMLYTHVPNETFTKFWTVKMKNKRMGVKKGFPDYIVLTNKEPLLIEMKVEKGGTTSTEQTEWINAFNYLGIPAKVCKGFIEAKAFVEEYL